MMKGIPSHPSYCAGDGETVISGTGCIQPSSVSQSIIELSSSSILHQSTSFRPICITGSVNHVIRPHQRQGTRAASGDCGAIQFGKIVDTLIIENVPGRASEAWLNEMTGVSWSISEVPQGNQVGMGYLVSCDQMSPFCVNHHTPGPVLRDLLHGSQYGTQLASNVCLNIACCDLILRLTYHSVLLFATLLTFVPQLPRIWLTKNATSILIHHVLLNLITATEFLRFSFPS